MTSYRLGAAFDRAQRPVGDGPAAAAHGGHAGLALRTVRCALLEQSPPAW